MISLALVPNHFGAPMTGTDLGPEHIYERLKLVSVAQISDIQTISPPNAERETGGAGIIKNLNEISHVCGNLKVFVQAALARENRVMVLHGDDSTIPGIGYGLSAAGIGFGLAYFDSHGDVNTPETSPSGYLYGMGVAHMLGKGAPEILDLNEGRVALTPSRLAYVGSRNLDPAEEELVARENIRTFRVPEVRSDPEAATSALVDHLRAAGVRDLYLHVDQDVVDPSESGACLCVEPDGIYVSELLTMVAALNHAFDLRVLSIGNYLPSADGEGRTLDIIRRTLTAAGFLS